MTTVVGGGVKKAYEVIGKKSICGKKRVIYKRVSGKPTRKVYMKHKGKFCQVKKFVAAMVAAGKWKKRTTTKKNHPNHANLINIEILKPADAIKIKLKKVLKKRGRKPKA